MNDNNALFEISLKVIIRNNKGEVLLLKQSKEYNKYGGIDIPGGRINDDELKQDILKLIEREIKEELGPDIKYKLNNKIKCISIMPLKTKDKGERDGVFYLLYEAKYISGKIQLSWEHNSYIWKKLTKNDVKNFVKIYHNLMNKYINSLCA